MIMIGGETHFVVFSPLTISSAQPKAPLCSHTYACWFSQVFNLSLEGDLAHINGESFTLELGDVAVNLDLLEGGE